MGMIYGRHTVYGTCIAIIGWFSHQPTNISQPRLPHFFCFFSSGPFSCRSWWWPSWKRIVLQPKLMGIFLKESSGLYGWRTEILYIEELKLVLSGKRDRIDLNLFGHLCRWHILLTSGWGFSENHRDQPPKCCGAQNLSIWCTLRCHQMSYTRRFTAGKIIKLNGGLNGIHPIDVFSQPWNSISDWWFQSLWKILKSIGMMTFPTEWKNISVPNHQPDLVQGFSSYVWWHRWISPVGSSGTFWQRLRHTDQLWI
jgi:hypothetical protein